MKQTQKTNTTRAKLGKYAFFLGSSAMLIGKAAAQTVADFTFESSYSSGTAGTVGTGASTGMTSGMLLAETGSGTAIGVHASASSVFSFPSGNGSPHAFSSNNFSVGDYYQFTINSAAYSNLTVSYDQVHSTTGPQDFEFQYSTDGTNFTNFASYSLASSGASTFATGSSNAAVNFSFNLSGVTALNNTTDYYRIMVLDTADAATSSGTFGSTGTSRVDNFLETSAIAGIPEPSSVALLSIAGVGALVAAGRRKRA